MAKISIIVPIYNSEKFISECIESILTQTYIDFELILIDDGSEDLSGTICKEYELQDQRVKYIYKANGGVSSARNEGIRYANGEYIAFIDSDDIVRPEMLKTLVKGNSDFSMCGYELYDDIRNTTSIQFPCVELCGTIHELAQNISEYTAPPYLLGPCFKLFKKNIIVDNDVIFPLELSYGEDAVFVLEYLTYCKTVSISSYIGYSYRKHGKESLSGRFLPEKIDINHRINNLIDVLLKKENIPLRKQIVADRLLECMVAYEKELICSSLTWKEKHKMFYQKFNCYKNQLGKPQRLAQWLIAWSGKYKICYPLVYLFKLKG
jgi:glycosyltransferase involved in cell wall biosynthesis